MTRNANTPLLQYAHFIPRNSSGLTYSSKMKEFDSPTKKLKEPIQNDVDKVTSAVNQAISSEPTKKKRPNFLQPYTPRQKRLESQGIMRH
jgi:hypothetical protein